MASSNVSGPASDNTGQTMANSKTIRENMITPHNRRKSRDAAPRLRGAN
jgi:hypothetical protein